MKLYYAPGACSLAPHIVLRESGTKFELEKLADWVNKKTESGEDFIKVNPKGAVPALGTNDNDVLTEVAVLVQYIADQAGASQILPKAGMERVKVQEWLNYISSELHKGFGPLFKPNTPDNYKEIIKNENLPRQFKYLDDHLAKNDFLTGGAFTVADAYLFTIMNWRHFHKVDISAYKNLSAYLDRIAARPKVQEAMQAEGLLKAA